MRLRRIESVCGILGGVLGLVALGVALVIPSDFICGGSSGIAPRGGCVGVSLVQQTGLTGQALPIALFGGASLGITLFTLWHIRGRGAPRLPALVLLWACTALLMVATVLSLRSASSPGLLFIPAMGLALVASIGGTLRAWQRRAVQG